MASSFEKSNHDSLLENEFIWEYQTNVDLLNATQGLEWTPFSHAKSSIIEGAYQHQLEEIFIEENCRIDLRLYIQAHIQEPYREEAIRRRPYFPSTNFLISEASENESSFRERLSSPLGLVPGCNTTEDTTYYGSPFIHTWLLIFTKGKMKVKFDAIYPVLVKGLIKEGEAADRKNEVPGVVAQLSKVEENLHGKNSKEKMKQLQDCCAKLYTRNCYIYRTVNTALCDNDQEKVYTLGPFAYLLVSFIGRRFENHFSIVDRLQGIFRSNESHSMIVYRGDRFSENTVEVYRRAAGDKSKYFKWLPFVSTSRNRTKAEGFARGGILYIIEMRYYSSNKDQFVDISIDSEYFKEEEILLLPGVLFQVDKLEFDTEKGLQLIYIKVKSSYTSKLK